MRSIVSGAYTLTTHPKSDLSQWCFMIDHTFPFRTVSSLLIEDCKVHTRAALTDFQRFSQQSQSLTLSGVEFIVEEKNDYGMLVMFLRCLRGLPMLAHVDFKNVTISYDYEDDDPNFVWRRTQLQLEKDKYEWNTEVEVRQGLDSLIHRFDNNVVP